MKGKTILILATVAITILGATPGSAQLPQFGHVVIVPLENSKYSDVVGSTSMPYLNNTLISQYGLATNYYADSHGSIPNYFVLTTGQYLTTNDNNLPGSNFTCVINGMSFTGSACQTVDNIALEAQNASKTWKAYAECLPSVGYTFTTSSITCSNGAHQYARHVPLDYFTNINTGTDLVAFEDPNVGFAHDLSSGTLPNFSFVSPNGCHQGHDLCNANGSFNSTCTSTNRATCLSQADTWLQNNINPLVQSSYFQAGGDGLLIITFDEDDNTDPNHNCTAKYAGLQCGGHVAAVVITPKIVKAGFQSGVLYQGENLLRLMAQGLGLNTSGLAAAAWANNMADFFIGPPPTFLVDKNWGACHNTCPSTPPFSIASSNFQVPAGDLIVAYCGVGTTSSDTATISDLAGNLFVQVGTTQNGSGHDALATFYAKNAIARSSDTVTCQWGAAHSDMAVTAFVYSGADPNSPLDATASGFIQQGTGKTVVQTGTFSTGTTPEFNVAGMMSGSSCIQPPTPGGGYAMEMDAIPGGCTGPTAAAEDEIAFTKQTNSTASMTVGNNNADMTVATFKPAVSLVATASGAYHNAVTKNVITSGSFSVSNGQLIVAYCGLEVNTTTPPTVTDTAGHTFTQIGSNQVNGSTPGDTIAMFYAPNAAGSLSDTVTCTWGSSATDLAVMVLVYQGAATSSPLDAHATGTTRGGTSITTSPAFSTTSPNEVVVAGLMSGSRCITAPTAGSGYTMEIDAIPSGCSGPNAATEDRVVSAQVTGGTASMGFSGATWADMIVATFKAGP